MRISDVLRVKGTQVVTVTPDTGAARGGTPPADPAL